MKRQRGDRLSTNKRQKSGKNSKKTETFCLADFKEQFSILRDYGKNAWNEFNQEVVIPEAPSFIAPVQQSDDCLSSHKRQKCVKISNKEVKSYLANLYRRSSDYGQDAWDELSQKVVKNLSGTVVPVASFIGNQMNFECTGIVVRSNEAGASILTSASLVRSVDDGSILMIQVCLPNKQVTIGRVAHCDLNYNLVVIIIPPFPGFRAAFLDLMKFGSHSKVVAVGCEFRSGEFKARTGVLTDEPSGVYPAQMRISTCKISLVMTGGPLIDSNGNIVGMNFYSEKCTPFLPSNTIFDFLVFTGEIKYEGPELILKSTSEIPLRSLMLNSEGASSLESKSKESMDDKPLPVDELTEFMRNDLQPRGYPMPTRLEGGMHLVNTFEEEFAEDTWCKFGKKFAANTSRTVVSLASFKDEKRFFACSGIFIDFNGSTSRILTSASLVRTSAEENRIDDNLKIKVYLPSKRIATGTLQYYNLSYNVAVVSIVGTRCLRTIEFNYQLQIEPQLEVVAVGRVFESGKLMATSGIVVGKESRMDCKDLMVTTCKITKAGIGGPLIDFDGNFVGMNFYGREETHFLPSKIIAELLNHSGVKWAVAGEAMDSKPNRWHVPPTRWYYPSSRAPRPQNLMILY